MTITTNQHTKTNENNDASTLLHLEDNPPNINPKLLLLFAFVTISLSSGMVYGWPSLRRTILSSSSNTLDEQALGAIFTTGSWSTQSSRFFFGIARDRCMGTRLTTCLSLACAALGIVGIAVFSNRPSGVPLATSMFFVGLGSSSQLCLQPVANLFEPDVQGTILSVLSGAFHVSGLVFLVLTSIRDDEGGMRVSFGVFGGILVALVGTAFVVLPQKQFVRKGGRERVKDGTAAAVLDDDDSKKGTVENEGQLRDGVISGGNGSEAKLGNGDTVMDAVVTEIVDDSLTNQLKSSEYIWLVIWFSALLIPLQYYIATIGYHMEQKGDVDAKYTKYFAILYAGSAVTSPFLGIICDAFGLGVGQGVATTLSAISLLLLSSDSISLEAHVLGMAFYGTGRLMVYGSFFSNVGKRFGYRNYGTLCGFGLLMSGIVSLLQYPLITAVTSVAGGSSDGRNSKIVNVGCGIGMLGMLPYCIWLGLREQSKLRGAGGGA